MATELRTRFFGRAYGDWRPRAGNPRGLAQLISRVQGELPPSLNEFVAPSCDFTNRIEDASQAEPLGDGCFRTMGPADGVVIDRCHVAAALFPGDCPSLCLYDERRLAVLHVGYRCLIRAMADEHDLVATGLTHFDRDRVRAWIGCGIGPCCWVPGFQSKP